MPTNNFAKIIRPDPIIELPDWVEENIRLPRGDPKEGKYRLSYTPYMREPLYELSPSVRTRKVVFIGPIQIGKTLLGTAAVLGWSVISPGPMEFVLPTKEMSDSHVEIKFDPMVEAMDYDIFPQKKSRQAGNTKGFKKFPGGSITFVGSEEKKATRSMSVRYMIISDADGMKGNLGGEGDAIAILGKRCAHYEGVQKILVESTLKIRGASHGEYQYKISSMGKYHIPCLLCDHMQYLEWGNRDTDHGLKYQVWKDGTIRRTWYRCPQCGGEIEERKKFKWLNSGQYVHENPKNEYRGFMLNGLQSPPGMVLWDDLALEWIQAQGKPEAIQVFMNTRDTKTYEHPGTIRLKWEVLKARAEPFRFFEIPTEVFMLSLGVDTHDKYLDLTLWGFGKGYEAWTVYTGELTGDPNDDYVWDELDKFLARDFPRKDGAALKIANCSVDMGGHRSEAVKLYTRKRGPRVIAVQGARGNLGPPIARPNPVDVTYGGQVIKGGASVWNINTYTLKETIYSRYQKETPGPGYIHFSIDLPEEFYRQLTAEELRMGLKDGYAQLKWENTRVGKQNHKLDDFVYALAGAMRIMPTIQILSPLPTAVPAAPVENSGAGRGRGRDDPPAVVKKPAPKPVRRDRDRSGPKTRKKKFSGW